LNCIFIYFEFSFEEKGMKGERGEKGAKGIRGDQGDKGLEGAKGYIGIPGRFGPRGPVGLQGETGKQGRTGQSGNPGLRGLNGEKVSSNLFFYMWGIPFLVRFAWLIMFTLIYLKNSLSKIRFKNIKRKMTLI
jgi:hypothetical protein